jgi:hypothetical protein
MVRLIWVVAAVVIGLQMGVAAQSEPKSVMPAARLEQARFELEHLDGDRNAMPDPARWPLSPTPATDAPRMLLFSSLSPAYLADHAAAVAKWGFRGFLLAAGSWNTDVWAVDGNPATRGPDDTFFRQVRECNRRLRAVGVDSNCLKISFDHHLPDWYDDAAWADLTERWRQLAIFARDTGCVGVAQDWEYVADQYALSYAGYDFSRYTEAELRAKVRERMRTAMGAMLEEFPAMVFFTLPENVLFFPTSLCNDMYQGVLEAMAARKAPGGLHLMVEFTYLERDPVWLIAYAMRVRELMDRVLSGAAREYWRSHCTIAEGGWPIGPCISGAEYAGLPYGGKTANYSAGQYRGQAAGMRMASPRYTWVYASSSGWWRYSADDMARYGGTAEDAAPTVPDVDAYRQATADTRVIANATLRQLSRCVQSRPMGDARQLLGMIDEWWIIGPFDSPDKKGLATSYAPERELDLSASYAGLSGEVRWQKYRTEDLLGVVDLGALLGEDRAAVAYAVCWVHADRATRGQVRVSSNDEAAVWLDGKPVWVRNEATRVRNIDADIAPVTIPAGTHPLLVKICNRGKTWEFCLRLTDNWGLPLAGVQVKGR